MQGFNMGRYIPPASLDPALSSDVVGGFNSQRGHPLGSRFSKSKQGITTVRFELPFDTWCETCRPEFLIKQGNRFNAEKKQVGKYLNTSIWEFSFRHAPCGGLVAIKTDPENTQYVVSAGGRKKAGAIATTLEREYGEQILTQEEREQREKNPFARLEGKVEENEKANIFASRIKELKDFSDSRTKHDYEVNSKLKRQAREQRKKREAIDKTKDEVKSKYSLAMELLDYHEDDEALAANVSFVAKPVKTLKDQVIDSVRAQNDPWDTVDFAKPHHRPKKPSKTKLIAPIKAQKRTMSQEPEDKASKLLKLVAYDSDDD